MGSEMCIRDSIYNILDESLSEHERSGTEAIFRSPPTLSTALTVALTVVMAVAA